MVVAKARSVVGFIMSLIKALLMKGLLNEFKS